MRGFLVPLLIAAAAPALAATDAQIERRYTRAYSDCMNSGEAAQGITPAMRACVSAELDRQDAKLNQAYHMVTLRLPPAAKIKLRNSERAWIKARDAKCEAEADEYAGGTIAPQIYSGCLLAETVRRTIWLESYR